MGGMVRPPDPVLSPVVVVDVMGDSPSVEESSASSPQRAIVVLVVYYYR